VRSRLPLALAPVLVALAASGCAAPEKDSRHRYATRKEGCDVTVFPENPSMPTDNIGPVQSTCSEDTKNEDCLRTLKDEACKLGADVVWGVSDVPSNVLGKKRFAGRAAHTKAAK